MTTEQHDSKTEGRGELERAARSLHENLKGFAWYRNTLMGTDKLIVWTRSSPGCLPETWEGFAVSSQIVGDAVAHATPSLQSPAEPERSDVLARQERMAELERRLEQLQTAGVGGVR